MKLLVKAANIKKNIVQMFYSNHCFVMTANIYIHICVHANIVKGNKGFFF